jgi:hypothetical protein
VAPHVVAPVPVESATQGAGAASVIAVATAGHATLAAAGKCARGKRRTYESDGNCKNNHSLPQHDDLSEDAPCLRHDFKRRCRSAARIRASSRPPESMNVPCDRFPDIAVVGARLLRFGRTSRVRLRTSRETPILRHDRLGSKRLKGSQSGVHPTADVIGAWRRVGFGPQADLCTAANSFTFDHVRNAARALGDQGRDRR